MVEINFKKKIKNINFPNKIMNIKKKRIYINKYKFEKNSILINIVKKAF